MRIKGTMTFFATTEGIRYYIADEIKLQESLDKAFPVESGFSDEFKQSAKENLLQYNVKGILTDGKRFIDGVLSSQYNNSNGKIEAVIIDGYRANLGIFFKDSNQSFFTTGHFLVTPDIFLKFCNEHRVQVDWREITSPVMTFD